MKNIQPVISLPFLIILLFVAPVSGASDKWVVYGVHDNGNVVSYNKTKVVHTTKDLVQVWTKKILSEVGREEYTEEAGFSRKKYGKLSYILYLDEIDCERERYDHLSITYYNADKKVIMRYLYDKRDWTDIPYDSTMNTLRQKVCK